MMAVTPVNSLNKQVASKTITKSIQKNDEPEKLASCNVAEKLEDLTTPLKRKRGRPKTKGLKNENKSPIVSNVINEDLLLVKEKSVTNVSNIADKSSAKCNILNDLKPEKLNPLKIVKRGRGRPKKIISNVVETDQIGSTKPTPKKRGRKKPINIIESTKELTRPILENNVISDVSSNLKMINVDVDADSNRLNREKINSINTVVQNLMSGSYLKCVTLERYDDNFVLTQTNNIKKVNITKSLNDIEPDLLHELNDINWNVPIRKRSKSSDKSLKMRSRRNSLSDNFVFNNFNELETKNEMKLSKMWKSLSYLEGGPNIQMERYQYNELSKKFRLELKRSRSFPNCMLLDTVIWRFLVYQQTYDSDDQQIYDSDDCTSEMSDEGINLTHELSKNTCHQYRSKSLPPFCKEYTYKNEKNNGFSKSQDDLNMCYDDYSSITSTKIFSDISNLENTAENNSEECKSKIRRSKRLNTKIKNTDILEEKYLLESDKDKFNYLLHAEQIRQENERQLSEARKYDPELEEKLKKLNFMFITNNMYRPHRKAMSMYTPAEAQELRRLKPKRTINGDAFNCHCKYTKKDWIEANPGCGSECLNRLLNIECGPSCLLKSFCTNKQFQNKQFKRTEIVKTPNKGYGVFALEDIPSGSFVDEYIGEVIDQHEMIKRMKKKIYINNNYMVQLKHDEIIDATRKGNITRFINHSCEPNCVAEKWNVLGESRMGFFSKNIIHKGEEITFDYSFEIFGDTKQQKCHCKAQKCRGVISKKSRTLYDENDYYENNTTIIKPGESKEKKEKNIPKNILLKNSKRLQELDQQLTDISKLKNKNRSDLESATLNLNKLMVHITDSMSRSHILKFIRENDLNCKRLFMNFNGLCIIHSWMTSSNNETLKLEIIQTLSDLPISNRNTITKSKVLDIVADWAKIPLRIKEIIENLEYPESKNEDHWLEVDKLLPDEINISALVHASRLLWKKWIILKMVFKIPKLERPKEIISQVSKDVTKPSISAPQKKTKNVQYHFGKPITSNQDSKIHCENNTKLNYATCTQGQESDTSVNTNSIDKFNKIINYQNQIISRDKNKAVHKWNKNLYERTTCNKSNNNIGSFLPIKTLIPYEKRKFTFLFNSRNNDHQEIPTIESGIVSNKRIKLSHSTECTSKIFDIPTDMPVKFAPTTNTFMNQSKIYPIETIVSTKFWSLPVPTISELNDVAVLESMLKMRPPCLPKEYKSSLFDTTDSNLVSFNSSWTMMNPENVLYDNQHPSIEEQFNLMSIQDTVQNKNLFLIDISDTNLKKTNRDTMIVRVSNENNKKRLLKQCEHRIKKLFDEGFVEIINSTKKNCMKQSLTQLFKLVIKNKALPISQQTSPFVHFFNTLKLKSNFYREQPSDLVKLHFINSTTKAQKNRDVFRIPEKTNKCDSVTAALTLCNKSLVTITKNSNIKHLFSKQSVEFNTSNKFACKIFNKFRNKLPATLPKQFVLQLSSDTKIYSLDQVMGLELQHKLTPTVNNTLCATFKKNGENVNVFEQRLSMKYDESKCTTFVGKKALTTQKNPVFSKNIEERKSLKRKLPLPPTVNIKTQKMNDLTTNHTSKLRTHNTLTNETNELVAFKKPILPSLNKKNSSANTTIDSQPQKISSADYIAKSNSLSKTAFDDLTQEPSTSSQFTSNSVLPSPSSNEIRQKPLMKCSPFNKLDNISAIELEQNVKNMAICLSNSYSSNVSSLPTSSNNELIDPIVDNFNSTMLRTNLSDDPIVRDYIQRTQTKSLELERRYKLPVGMRTLPPEVLRLIPDNLRLIRCVVDFYHAMATVIVKNLDSYVKKTCKQGRIKNDEDFKFLAKKLNSNILIKELQVKSIDDLRITDSIRQRVEAYITKYMLKYGRVYKRKSTDTPTNQ